MEDLIDDQEQEPNTNKASFVYLLICSDGSSSYVGATVDLDHRLRQHNGKIKGGAVATTSKLTRGRSWIRAAHVEGFPDWKAALQFEWRWKNMTRKLVKHHGFRSPLDNRLFALSELLALDRSTSKAVPYSEWPAPPLPVFETQEAQTIWDAMQTKPVIIPHVPSSSS
jgi:structure-specific endonuclease subunit SLX1